MKFSIFTVKGLEQICLEEVKQYQVENINIRNKYISFDSQIKLSKFLKLKTVDDIGLNLFEQESATEVDSNYLEKILQNIDFKSVINALNQFRSIDKTFSLTLSMANCKQNLTTEDILIPILKNNLKFNFTDIDHSNFDIRIFIDANFISISVRLDTKPLYKRDYLEFNTLGSLRPSIAASMLQVLDFNSNIRCLDMFCGRGTILCEAFLRNNQVFGCDIDFNAVNATIKNLKNLGFSKINNIKHSDFNKKIWNRDFFDLVVSNLPWDKQIKVLSITEIYKNTILETKRVLKEDGNFCFLVHKPEIVIKLAKKHFPTKTIHEIKLGYLGQQPSMVFSR